MTASRLSARIAKLETVQGNRSEILDLTPEELRPEYRPLIQDDAIGSGPV
jgi:hypothetical protein